MAPSNHEQTRDGESVNKIEPQVESLNANQEPLIKEIKQEITQVKAKYTKNYKEAVARLIPSQPRHLPGQELSSTVSDRNPILAQLAKERLTEALRSQRTRQRRSEG